MKKIGLFVGVFLLIVAAWGGYFYWQNLRGAAPAVAPPVADITRELPSSPQSEAAKPAENSTGLPLKLPDGFAISVFAKNLVNPRVLTWDPKGTLLTSIPAQGKVVALVDANGDGVSDATINVVTGLRQPHGLAFHDGKLYVAETNAVDVFDYNPETRLATGKKKIIDLSGGGYHFTRTIAFGPDGKLYISVGSTCNVCVETNWQRAKLLVANADGSNLKVFASGLRNTVFFTWNPMTHELWGNDMGRDQIGDDIPPDDLNIIQEGNNYGWPYCYGDRVHDSNFDPSGSKAEFCKTTVPPHVAYPAHSAPLGLTFVPTSWPKEYQNNLLVAFHGSWNRTVPTGYKIVRLKLDAKGNSLGMEDFISGWFVGSGAIGRPVDLLFDTKGVLYVSDDKAGVVYRISRT